MSALPFSLTPFNTFGLVASCKQLARFDDTQQLISGCLRLKACNEPFIVLGGGSNLLLLEDYAGTVVQICTKGIVVDETDSDYLLNVAAGESWHGLVEFCLQRQLPGLENMALIPGTVGAAPIQNIGAYGVEFASVCDWVDYLDIDSGSVIRLPQAQCQFGYRESIFKQQLKHRAIVVRVGIKLPKRWQPVLSYGPLQVLAASYPTAQQIFDVVCDTRRQRLPDPTVLGNVGSCFKNPVIPLAQYQQLQQQFPGIVGFVQANDQVKLAAAWLIDRAGFKGQRFGGVKVHEQQALVLVNTGNAVGADVLAALSTIQTRIAELFDVRLEAEPRLYGQYGERSMG